MAMIYQFRLGSSQFPVAPQIVGEAIEALGGHNSGEVTPERVVAAARAPESPLHPIFEWDDTLAAERWRYSQAGDVLRSVVAVIPEQVATATPTRAFVSVRSSEGPVYVPIRTAMTDPALRQQVLAGAMREIVSWRQRHKELKELAELFAQVDWLDEQRKKGEKKP